MRVEKEIFLQSNVHEEEFARGGTHRNTIKFGFSPWNLYKSSLIQKERNHNRYVILSQKVLIMTRLRSYKGVSVHCVLGKCVMLMPPVFGKVGTGRTLGTLGFWISIQCVLDASAPRGLPAKPIIPLRSHVDNVD